MLAKAHNSQEQEHMNEERARTSLLSFKPLNRGRTHSLTSSMSSFGVLTSPCPPFIRFRLRCYPGCQGPHCSLIFAFLLRPISVYLSSFIFPLRPISVYRSSVAFLLRPISVYLSSFISPLRPISVVRYNAGTTTDKATLGKKDENKTCK